jgi:hypothetical protein
MKSTKIPRFHCAIGDLFAVVKKNQRDFLPRDGEISSTSIGQANSTREQHHFDPVVRDAWVNSGRNRPGKAVRPFVRFHTAISDRNATAIKIFHRRGFFSPSRRFVRSEPG